MPMKAWASRCSSVLGKSGKAFREPSPPCGGWWILGGRGYDFLVGGANGPSCFSTRTNSIGTLHGCAMSAHSHRRRWSNGAGRSGEWCEETNRQLGDLSVEDLDDYFVTQGVGRWSRVFTASTASALRAFLRYAAMQGQCEDRLAASVCRPRLYQQESLPYAPDWSDVQRMLDDVDMNKPRDICDRAILLLLAIYGMRSGEVAA